MRKIITIILSLALVLSLFIGAAGSALAADDDESNENYLEKYYKEHYDKAGAEAKLEAISKESIVFTNDDIVFDTETGYVIDYEGSASSLTIPSSIDGVTVTGIDDWAFESCISLTSITLPSTMTYLGEFAFAWCESLANFTIPSSVSAIGDHCFAWCDALASIDAAPTNADYSSVDGVLFNKSQTELIQHPPSKSGTTYAVPGSVTTIADWAFAGNLNLLTISIPSSVTSIGDEALACENMTSIEVSSSNPNYCDVDGILFNKSMTKIVQYPAGKSATAYAIPSGVTIIGIGAFEICENLISVAIPSSVETIEPFAFALCSALTSISIPSGVTRIEYATFVLCESLTRVDMPTSVEYIGEDAFGGCHQDLAFYGTLGSYAQSYAGANGIPFYINIVRYEDAVGDGMLLRTFFNESDDIVCKEYYRGPSDTFARIQADYFNMAGTMVFTEIYDLTDTIIASVWFQADGVTKQFKNYYAAGQLFFQEEYDVTDTIIASIWFQADGFTKYLKNYYSGGMLYFQEEYDTDGYIIASIWFQADGVTRNFKNYYEYGSLYFQEEYNASGTMIASIDFRWDGTRERKCYYRVSDGSLYLIEYYDENEDLIYSEWF